MFGLFKKKIDLRMVLNDFADDLQRVRDIVDELAKEKGIATKKNYTSESAALAYILGWLAIQTSHLDATERHRFSTELTGEWSKRMNNGVESMETIKFLQSRISMYRDAMDNGEGRDWMARLIIRFLKQFGINSPEHVGIMGALYVSIPGYLETLSGFLNGVKSQYKLA